MGDKQDDAFVRGYRMAQKDCNIPLPLTREEILQELYRWVKEYALYLQLSNRNWGRSNERVFQAIRRLVEQGKPRVSREWVELKLLDLPRDIDEQIDHVATILREAGVEVEDSEKGSEEEK